MNTRFLILAGLGLSLTAIGCGETTDDTTDGTTGTPVAGTPEVTPTATETATATATPVPAAKYNITFTVDTTSMADGTNMLAAVLDGEAVYLVGDFAPNGVGCDYDNDADDDYPCWKPQEEALIMTANGDGTWSATLSLTEGGTLQYKYVKTTTDPVDNGWGNGPKDFYLTSEKECTGDETGATGGLWEIANFAYTVPSADAVVDTYMVPAWRDYAFETYAYPACD